MAQRSGANKQTGKALFQQANEAYFDDDFKRSESLFTQAIAADASEGDYYLKRAQVRNKLGKNEEAAGDALKAANITSGKSEQLRTYYKALLLHGEWSFDLKNYDEAAESLRKAAKINPNDEKVKTLLEKVEPLTTPVPEPAPAVEEATEQKPAAPARPKVRHEWYQNDSFVIIEVFVRNVKKDALEVEILDNSLSLSIKLATGSENNLDFDPLQYKIVPGDSKYEVLSTKIEIRLKKAAPGQKWDSLEKSQAELNAASGPQNLSNSRKGISWDKIAADAERETALKASEKNVNELFQSIYKDADEDTRRAMMKSYIESNGTALSTDWKSVGKGPVETVPPTDCVAKPFSS
ncbi:Cochaperone protein [Dipsacomyces acuminosporus]|nr:Cochaperone protein [Dipsacomyces acuminosporus]